jgi:hypothetical protein
MMTMMVCLDESEIVFSGAAPEFVPAMQNKLLRARVAPPQSSVMTSLLNVNVWTPLQLLVGHYYRQGDYWVVKMRPMALLLDPFSTQKEPMLLSNIHARNCGARFLIGYGDGLGFNDVDDKLPHWC